MMRLIATLFGALVAMTLVPLAMAQEELNDDREILEREEKNQVMSEPTYKRLSQIHELMGENNAEALSRAETMEKSGRLNNYEKALILQTIGFIHANENRMAKAVDYFERSLALDSLGTEAQQGMLYSLASLYVQQEKYRKGIATAREWFKYEADPKGEAYMLIGSSFAQMNEFLNALPYVKKAIAKADKPNESWYQLELAIYFETDQIPRSIPLLRKMITIWPDKDTYWETLSGAHMQLDQDRDALSTMMVAYHKGMIDEEDQVLSLVKLNLFLDIPYTAGEILAEQIATGLVVKNKETLELLRSAWTGAQEYERALAVMTELGNLTGEAEYAIDQAKIYNELAQWESVIESANVALQRNYDKPGEAHLLIGTAYSELEQLNNAIKAFRSAESVGSADERRNAKAWIGFVQDRINSRT